MLKKGIFFMKRLAGRPPKYDDDFYLQIHREHEELFSLSQLAEHHKVSLSTAKNWVRKGKVLANEQKQ